MSAAYPEGTTAQVTDDPQRSLVKIVELLNNGAGGGGGGGAFSSGADYDPNGIVTGDVGDVYVSSIPLGGDGTTWHKVSGNGTNTGWE